MMTQDQNNPELQPASGDYGVNLLELLLMLAKNKGMIMKLTLAAAMLAIALTLMLDNIYTATAKALPPQPNQSSSSNAIMLAQLGGLPSGAGAALGLKNPIDIYLAMLKSRNVREKIVQRFELQKVYQEKTLTETLKELEKNSAIVSGKDSIIVVEVDDKDPQRAADMANAYIDELNKLMQTLAVTEALQRRRFFENQMKPAKDKLTDAEITLDRTLRSSLQYMNAVRNLKYQESIYDILIKQYEIAKLDEAKNSPLIQILDKAYPPEKKSRPIRSLIVLVATVMAFFLAVFLALIKEALSRSNNKPEQAAHLEELRRLCRWKT